MTIESNQHLELLEKIYIFVFCLVNIQFYLTNSSIPMNIQSYLHPIYTSISLISIVFLLFKIFSDNHRIVGYTVIIILLILSIIIYFYSKELTILSDILLILGAKNIKFTHIMKTYFYIGSTLVIFLMSLSLLKIIPNIATVGHISGMRYSLGFGGPVKFSESIITLSIVYFILNFDKIKWTRILILIFLAIFILIIPDTRMDFYGMIMLIIIVIFQKICPKILNKFPFNAAWLSLLIMTILSFYSAIFYNSLNNSNYLYSQLNKSIENRFLYSNYWLTSTKPTLFGRNLTKTFYIMSPNGVPIYNYIDQSIIRLTVMYGVLILIIFLIAYTYKMFRLYKFGMNYFVLLFSIIVFRGFFDVNLLQIIGDPFLLILCSRLSNIKNVVINLRTKS